MEIDVAASENSYYQVSREGRDVPALGVRVHFSCKEGQPKRFWFAVRSRDGSVAHVDARRLPGCQGVEPPLQADQRLDWMAALLLSTIKSADELQPFLVDGLS